MPKVYAKWGFGNAPLKADQYAATSAAIQSVRGLLADIPERPTESQLEALSHVKGQFNRIVRQDQWDWCTVWLLLGRPSRGPAKLVADTLGILRRALVAGDKAAAVAAADRLRSTSILKYFDCFLQPEGSVPKGASGFIYILSTRDQPRLLKIGVTQRSVEDRVKEINSATGVAIPFGIRGAWHVPDARDAEVEIHRLLEPHRVRVDREFFELEFVEACRMINDYLASQRRLRREA